VTDREIDVLVAEKVMGLTVGESNVPPYSSDIAAAWEVMKELSKGCMTEAKFSTHEDYIKIVMRCMAEDSFVCEIHKCPGTRERDDGWEHFVPGNGKTAPMAICIAALRFKGVEIDPPSDSLSR
jgi:hypothetical protein